MRKRRSHAFDETCAERPKLNFKEWDTLGCKLRNKRIAVSRHKYQEEVLLSFTRLGIDTEPRVIETVLKIGLQSAEALRQILNKIL